MKPFPTSHKKTALRMSLLAAMAALAQTNALADVTISTATTTTQTLSNNNLTITSTGSITTGNPAINSSGTITTLSNAGSITTTGAYSNAINNSGTITTLTNAGSIAAHSITIFTYDTITTLTNTSSGTITGDQVIYNSGMINTLTNNGSITGRIGIYNDGTITTLTNTSSGTIKGSDYAIYSWHGATLGTINNAGTIAGWIKSDSANTPTLTINGGSGTTFGVLTGYGATTSAADIGIINTNNTANVVFGSGNTLLNDNINVGSSHTVTNTAATLKVVNPITITGNYTQASGATLVTTVANASSFGKLTITGTATLGGTLNVDAASATGLSAGTSLASIIHANGGITGTFASVTTNSTLFDFTAAYTATDVNLSVKTAASSGGNSTYKATVATGNQPGTGAAKTLDAIFAADASGPLALLFRDITGGDSAVSAAVSQTLPLLTTGTTTVTQGALGSVNRVIQTRQDSLSTGMGSGDDFYGDKNFWLKPFGSWARQADRESVSGYKARTSGFALGADATLDKHNRVGVALAYANAHVTGNSSTAPNSANIDLYQLIGYGSYSLDANTEINYQADISNNKNEGQRSILFANSVAKANYNSFSAHVGAGIARTYKVSEKTSFTPSVRMDYTTLRDKAYSETGAGVLNLNVASKTTNELTYTAEAKLSHALNESHTLLGSLGAAYTPNAKASSTTAAYAGESGMSFNTTGASPEHWTLRGGLGVVSKIKNGPEVTTRYDLDHRSGFNNHSISAKVKWGF